MVSAIPDPNLSISSSSASMAASDCASHLPNPHEPSNPFVIVSLVNIIKLDPTNYFTWKVQIQATLDGFDLFKFLDGSHKAPAETITSNETTKPNPAFLTFKRQDRILFGAVLGTLSQDVAPLVLSASSSQELWASLETTFGNPSRGHIKQIKDRLRSTVKGNLSATEYMQKMKATSSLLASLKVPVSQEDLTDYILRGLDKSFKPVVHYVNSRDNPISFEALHEKLINHELELKRETKESSAPMAAFPAASKPTKGKGKFPPSQFPWQQSSPAPPPKPNPNWTQPSPNWNQQVRPPPSPSGSKPFRGRCQWCKEVGHVLTQCPVIRQQHPNLPLPTSSRFPSAPPQAHTASTAHPNSSWIVDSGATNHVTNDLNNLAIHYPYTGPDDLFVGDGTGHQVRDNPS